MSRLSQTLRAMRIGLVAMCATAIYETTKVICSPRISVVQSRIITIFFAGCVGFCISFIVRQREKRAQEGLLRLATIVQHSDDAIISTELDGTVTSWNHGAERIYGYSAVEALGQHISFCVPPEKRTEFHTFLQRIANGEAIERFDTQRLTKNGAIIDVSLSVSAIRGETGKPVGVSGIARDVTARRRAQDALIESERRYRSLFENMLEGFAYCEMLFDDRGRPTDFVYLAVNSSFGSLTGLADVVGKRFTEVIPGGKDSQPELFERYGRVVLTGKPERFEIEIKALGMWFSISAHSAGKGCFVATFDNITERKQAEEALLFKTALLEAQAETTIDGILAVDESNHIVLAKKQFGRNFEIPDELLSTRDDLT